MQKIERMISCEQGNISYLLEQKLVKNLNLRIRTDGSVYVSANPEVPLQKVDEFVSSKSEYICASQKKFAQMIANAPKPKQYVSGETFYLLGHGLRLKVEQKGKETVFSDGAYIFLQVKNTSDFKKKERLMTRYLNTESQKTFDEIMATIYPVFEKYGIKASVFRVRKMDTRWGTCLPGKGIITLNKRLIEVPRNGIEYVVMHECCHFIPPNHSKRFYTLLTTLMPDWRQRKDMLEKWASGLSMRFEGISLH